MRKSNAVALLFSGGIDSTGVAVYYLKQGKPLHLLTMRNGSQRWLELAQYKADWIIKAFPEQCRWVLLDSAFLFHALAIKPLESDVKIHGNLVCVGCKLAMLAEAVVYCRRNRIKVLADGFRKAQEYYPEQTPEFIRAANGFARAFGITYAHPFYDDLDTSLEDLALSGSVPPAPIQPYCLFERNRVKRSKSIAAYMAAKLPAAKAYVRGCLGG